MLDTPDTDRARIDRTVADLWRPTHEAVEAMRSVVLAWDEGRASVHDLARAGARAARLPHLIRKSLGITR